MWKREIQETPFPNFEIKGKRPLDLVHSNLDEMPVLSIGGYKYTTTYLDDYSSFGVMFYLKRKVMSSLHSSNTKLGPKDNLVLHWNADNSIVEESSYQMKKKCIWWRMELKPKRPCQTLHNKMDEQKGSSKPS